MAENINTEVYVEKYEEPTPTIIQTPIELRSNGIIKISANKQITVNTQDGYFISNHNNIKMHKRTDDYVTFSIPFGVADVSIKIKEKGNVVEKTYQVV